MDSALTLSLHPSVAEIPAAEWDSCGDGNPFTAHAFLLALEESGSTGPRTGWLPQHVALRGEDGALLACAPCHAKAHSYGEYVFDHGWAEAFERAGGRYYPKLQVASPFSPVPGARLLRRPGVPVAAVAEALRQAMGALQCSSVHVTSRVTASFGVAPVGRRGLEAALAAADRALYAAKQGGRDRVEAAIDAARLAGQSTPPTNGSAA